MITQGEAVVPKGVLIAGYYGFGNTGDEAILSAILKDLRTLQPDLDIHVVSGNPAGTASCYHVRSVLWTDIQGIIEHARACDLIILGGGGLFHDYWGAQTNTLLTGKHAGIPFFSGFPLLAWLLDKPCMIYAVGVGPLFSTEGKDLTRLAFELADVATLRDAESKEILKSLGLSVDPIRVTADPAFRLPIDEQNAKVALQAAGVDNGKPLVAVCLRHWDVGIAPETWQPQVAAALDSFLETIECSLVFIPFQNLPAYPQTNDLAVAEAVIAQMKHAEAATVLRGNYAPEVIAGILSQCDLTVGMRLHSIIFAAMAGVPFVGLTYDPKVTNLLRRLRLLRYALPLSAGMGEKLLAAMLLAWDNRHEFRKKLATKTKVFSKFAGESARLAITLLENGAVNLSKQPLDASLIREFALKQTRLLAEQEQATQAFSAQLVEQVRAVQRLTGQVLEGEGVAQVLTAQVTEQEQKIRALAAKLAERDQFLWRVRLWLAPHGSRRERMLRFVIRGGGVKRLLTGLRQIVSRFQRWVEQPPLPFTETYVAVDNSQVTLYTDDPSFFPSYSPRRSLSAEATEGQCQVSLIASVKNESENIREWMNGILSQTRLPDEIVIVDGGSTDGTGAMLQSLAKQSPIPLRIIIGPGTNIARGRNIAIDHARFPIIAITDFGCQPNTDWLEKLIQPFELEPDTQVSAGFYDPLDRKGRSLGRSGIWIRHDQIHPQHFLPSSRSVAFAKDAWQMVGGYPEWLTLTGEDTYFDLELKRLGGKWAFVPDAVVQWYAPDTLGAYIQKMYQWAIGDGESSVHARYYWRYVLRLVALTTAALLMLALAATVLLLSLQPPGIWLGLIVSAWLFGLWLAARRNKLSIPILLQKTFGEAAQVAGFLKGARRRKEIDRRRFSLIKGVFFILSGVPIDDTGGGARGTQLALELLRQGYAVVFINRFPKDESRELNLRYAHPNLLVYPFSDFAWEKFREEHLPLFDGKMIAAIVEFPLPDYLPLIKNIRECGGVVVYDLLDAWDTSLGGQWFSPGHEMEIIRSSQALVATVPALVERLERISGRNVTLLPNAVDTRLFDPGLRYVRPADLPAAKWTIIYIGALWGEWFDWNLLRKLAIRYSDASVAVIGDYRGQCSQPPQNLHFLGLKPQRELPAYLAHADVAIIPWKVSAITQATSPIKTFEYLAMRCPVVAPNLEPLRRVPGVLLAQDAEDFIALVDQARRSPVDEEAITAFLDENDWHSRVTQLVACVQKATTESS